MPKLVFDIETIGEDFDSFDAVTKESLTHWIRKESADKDEYQSALEDMKNGMGFSPLTGSIVAIGMFNPETEKGEVCFQAPSQNLESWTENNILFSPMTEKEMLEKFWNTATHYQEFISFNGKAFDVPFLMVRSAIHQIRPSKDLMSNRYLGSQKFDAKHVDLLDQLTFYGAVRKRGNLHLWCRAFGIKSPKAEGVKGDDVAGLFKEKKFREIAQYNVGDLRATKELYEYWDKFIRF
jgi:DNA polymerase elongation subunit (family B)